MSQLQETSMATGTEIDNFDELVELDIRGKADEAQVDVLMSDAARWREALLDRMWDLDRQLTERKALSIADGGKHARTDYELWKKGAVARKTAILECLREAKAVVKDENREKFGREQFMEIQCEELKRIRELLEIIVAGKPKKKRNASHRA